MVTAERVVKGNGTHQKCIARYTHKGENSEKKGEADCYKIANSKVWSGSYRYGKTTAKQAKKKMTKWKKSTVYAVQEML